MKPMDKFGLYGMRLVRRPNYYMMRFFGRFVTVQRVVRRLPGRLPLAARNGTTSLFPDIDTAGAVAALRRDGIYVGMRLPQATVDEIRQYADTAMCYANFDPTLGFRIARLAEAQEKIGRPIVAAEYFNASEDCPAIKQLATDPLLLEVASRYFGRRASCMGSLLHWTMVNSAGHDLKADYAQMFHFDLDDYAVLKYFFYLTPVDELSGPHVCVRGSHRIKRMRAAHYSPRARLVDEQVERFYGRDNIARVLGPAGTGFALDPFCIHKGSVPLQQPRLALLVQFVLRTYGFEYGTRDRAALKRVF